MDDIDTDPESYPKFTCPRCGEHTVVREIFGMPAGDLFEASERGDVLLGGCCIDDGYTGREVGCTSCGWLGQATKDFTKVRARRAPGWADRP